MKYLDNLTQEQAIAFMSVKQTAEDEIQDYQESFLSGDRTLEEASELIIEVHKRLKDLLETFNR